MKLYKILILVLLSLALGACGNATPTLTEEQALGDVYTAVAMTFVAQANVIAMQSTPTPNTLPTSFSSPTSFASLTPYPTATSSYSYGTVGNGCYSSVYLDDVTIEDGTELAPGEYFTKKWKLQNTGTCAWNEDFLLRFYSGDDMDGVDTVIDDYVVSGDTTQVAVELTAPETDGTYTGYWIMADSSGVTFGNTFYVQIVVSSDLSTSTPTPTATEEAAYTSTPTSVPTDTPTEIPTETPVPTDTPASDETTE